ncbi:MAG: CvpA family protein [Bacteroidota bacterium]
MAIDIMFAIAVATGFYLGFARGIIGTVFNALSLIFGLMAAFRFADPMNEFLKHSFGSDNPLMFAAGFALSFVITMFLIRTIARGLEGILKTANINIINQFAGGLLVSVFMVLVYSVLLWFADQTRLVNREVKDQSRTYVYVKEFPAQVKQVGLKIQPIVVQFWHQSLDMMDRMEEMSIERTEQGNVYDIPDEENAPTAEESDQ